MTDKDRIVLNKMLKWARKAEIDYQAVCSEFEPGPFSNPVILTAFSLAQTGEISGRLSDELKARYRDIPWKQIKGLRNIIIHDYDGIQMNIVKETMEQDIPILIAQLQAILEAEA